MAISLLGALGAWLRFTVGNGVLARWPDRLALGTFVVNLSGSFLLGTLVGIGVEDRALLLLGTGLLGSYTTFSTSMVESHRLAQAERWTLAGLNLFASLLAGFAAVSIGMAAGAAMAS